MFRLVVTLVFAVGAVAVSSRSQAFWDRSQVSHCADATTDAERLRHRCYELKAYADPGWPALGLGEGVYGYRAYRYKSPVPALPPGGRPPVRRLG
ncbi:MAG TPA: hypothetical protein VGN82_11375 [Bosea sp. (in: a-proteobacteria)]|uniref:hypothetical protein n=1 Tax=Bosea sp. (in: a-proteobacteria) TaxID=1871050 RepID=UPI002E0D19EE|nr:hypothetical protein [Bosea sp. (in: a-proteobacteria)]